MITQSLVTRLALGAALIAGAASVASAQDSGPLIDALVRKGILTDQEGEELRADLLRDFGGTSPGKLDISSNITRLRISGDARVRYQYDNQINNGATQNANDQGRFRYRVRVAGVADLGPKWTAGVRIETESGATSTNANFGDNFAKTNDTAYFGQAYIRYTDSGVLGADSLQLDFGKFSHKFFNPGVNGFWIDSDINFEGFAQDFAYTDVFGRGNHLAVRAGQFVLNNNNASTADEAWLPSLLHIVQAQANVGKVTIAPAFVVYGAPSSHDAGFSAAQGQNDSSNYTDLATVLVPLEYSFTIGDKASAVYATYGVNLRGDERAGRLTNNPGVDDDAQMYNVGFRYGNPRNAGEYGLTAEYRYVGNGAYTSLLLDSDFNGGRLNGEGFILSGTYNWTAFASTTVTYFNSFNINETLPTNQNSNGMGFGSAEVLQVDLSVRF